MRINDLFRSYSFRSGALIFLAFSMTLVAIRISIYAQSLHTAYGNIRLIIDAHAEELNENIERYGVAYANGVINAVIADAGDDNLFIALKSPQGIFTRPWLMKNTSNSMRHCRPHPPSFQGTGGCLGRQY